MAELIPHLMYQNILSLMYLFLRLAYDFKTHVACVHFNFPFSKKLFNTHDPTLPFVFENEIIRAYSGVDFWN